MVDVSFIATVYNSVDTVSVSLQSIIEIIEKLPNLDFEIVIVDNFSNDGTYEKLLDFKVKAMNTRHLKRFLVVRLRSSRGLGRQL
ncbi:MAG: glycosyltransferase, partial [Nitrososphaerota archaeon]